MSIVPSPTMQVPSLKELLTAQQHDDHLQHCRRVLADPTHPDHASISRRYYLHTTTNLIARHSQTTATSSSRLIVVIPDQLRPAYLHLAHCDIFTGHRSAQVAIAWARDRFYWPSLQADLRRFIGQCVPCALHKRRRQPSISLTRPIAPSAPFVTLGVDCVGPLPRTANGHEYVLVALDLFSRFAWFLPMCTPNAPETVSLLLKHVFSVIGFPAQLLSDRGPNFTAALVTEFCRVFNISSALTATNHPSANGRVERVNAFLAVTLGIYHDVAAPKWDDLLPMLQLAYNTTPHAAIGTTPASLMLTTAPLLPIDLPAVITLPPASQQTPLSIQQQIEQIRRHVLLTRSIVHARENIHLFRVLADQEPIDVSTPLAVGNVVLVRVRTRSKLEPRFYLATITRALGSAPHSTFRVRNLASNLESTQNRRNLHLFSTKLTAGIESTARTFEVQRILAVARFKSDPNTQRMYTFLVHWKHYPLVEASWQPFGDLNSCKDMRTDALATFQLHVVETKEELEALRLRIIQQHSS